MKAVKCVFFILVFGLLVPTNYSGNIRKAQNISNSSFVKAEENRSIPNAPTNKEREESVRRTSHFKIQVYFTIWIIFILAASTVILLTILVYLNSQPLYKQCLLLYLYQDVLRMFLAKVWFWSCTAMVYKVHGYGTAIENNQAKMISYVGVALNFTLLVALNLSSFLKLFIAKSKTLDPIETFYGYDDRNALQRARFFILVLIATIIILMYTNDCNGSQYYFLRGDNIYLKDMPTGTIIIQSLMVILFLSFAFSHILQIFYNLQSYNVEGITATCQGFNCIEDVETEQNIENSTVEMQDTDSGLGTNASMEQPANSFATNRPISKRFSKNILAFSAFLTPSLAIGVGWILMFMADLVKQTDWWNFILIAETIEGIILPFWLISTNGHLRIHVKRRFDLAVAYALQRFEMNLICRKLKGNSSKVEPQSEPSH